MLLAHHQRIGQTIGDLRKADAVDRSERSVGLDSPAVDRSDGVINADRADTRRVIAYRTW
jgi:hypothetical protein